MLLSHRTHCVALGTSYLGLHRAIAPSFMVRRAVIRELVQDDELTQTMLGIDCERARRRVVIVLHGSLRVSHGNVSLGPGDALFVPEGVRYAGRAVDCDLLELEWDPGALDADDARPLTSLRLGGLARACVARVAEHLRSAKVGAAVTGPISELVAALVAEGFALDIEAARAPCVTPHEDQALLECIDGALCQLSASPMLVDLEGPLAAGRRTLSRKIQSLHQRYALLGRGHGRWRGIRDVYRMLVASILMSHRDATPRSVAGLVGYGSIEALDHAFRHARLPAPAVLRRAVLRDQMPTG